MILRGLSIPQDDSIPCCETSCDCPPSTGNTGSIDTGSPSSTPPPSATGPILPPDLPLGPVNILEEPYWDARCSGDGAVPSAADPEDAEDWAA
jgi:hypothetical protein